MLASLSSYSLSKKYPYASFEELLKYPQMAKDLGYAAIEFAVGFTVDAQAVRVGAKALRQALDDAGMPCVALCAGADFLKNDVKAQAEGLRHVIEAAAVLGAPVVRHDATSGPTPEMRDKSFAAALPRLAEGCAQVAAFAAGLSVKTCVENHGYFVQDSCRVAALHEAVAHPNFGLLVDIGNFMCADETPAQAVAATAPYAVHAHVKDFHFKPGTQAKPGAGWFPTRSGDWLRGAILGHGEVPVGQCLGLLKRAGYDGYVTVEFEGLEEPDMAVADALENLKRYL